MRILEKKRSSYLKSAEKKNNCAFCTLEEIDGQVCVSLTTDKWMVIASRYPYMDGNLMIIPRRHVEDIDDLTDEEKNEWFAVLRNTKKRLGAIFSTESFNISINLGQYSARSIAHIHWQIIPRTKVSNPNAINIFQDLYVISMSHEDVVKLVDGENKGSS